MPFFLLTNITTTTHRHVRTVGDPYTLAKWQDCRKRVAQEAELCKDILQETSTIRCSQPAPAKGRLPPAQVGWTACKAQVLQLTYV